MSITVTMRDETTAGKMTNELTVDFLSERVTVAELIRSRVYQEVQDHNMQAAQSVYRGLVHPTDAEKDLNGVKLKQPRQIDWKKQFDVAVEAFERNGFLLLVDNRQAKGLNQEFVIKPGSVVSFLKLVPLVGG